MNPERRHDLLDHLTFIYEDEAEAVLVEVLELLDSYVGPDAAPQERLSERDIVLISYGDQVATANESPLATLHQFLKRYVEDAVTGVHLLPFYPYTSDDGFSVVDYLAVDPALGGWDDVAALGEDYRLMFDAVINHVSVESSWFQAFLRGEAPYTDFFITEDPTTDLSRIVRPRTTPLLTPFETAAGTKHVWTTFSADQVDLNYANPQVLLEVVKVLLEYARRGAEIIRLDAVTYLWKEPGHESVHHPKTHRVLQLLRSVIEEAAPGVVVLTETNVPHNENVSYFGDGTNEAQMVYNFALPPLVLYSYLTQDARALQSWARDLTTPSSETTFFNFLASHDGVGVRAVESILGPEGIADLAAAAESHGGFVSYKTNSDGSQSPYELNISLFDALNDPTADTARDLELRRFLGAHSIMLTLQGVPGLYWHSLVGSRSWSEGVRQTGRNRSINREKLSLAALEKDLDTSESLRSQVLAAFKPMLKIRQGEAAFHPQAGQEVLTTAANLFVLKRFTADETVYCVHNLSSQAQPVTLPEGPLYDVLLGESVSTELSLDAFETRWLKVELG